VEGKDYVVLSRERYDALLRAYDAVQGNAQEPQAEDIARNELTPVEIEDIDATLIEIDDGL
jgi:hypothetical protein